MGLARRWIDRLGRPLSAGLLFCAAGLLSAVFAVGVNRMVSAGSGRPPVAAPPPGVTTGSPAASPSPPAAASPSPAAASAPCDAAPAATGALDSTLVAAPVTAELTDGDSTLEVVIPAGARLEGRPADLHARLDGVEGDAHLRGTLVRDVVLCARGAGGDRRVQLPGGSQVDGSGAPGATGVVAADIHVRPAGKADDGGG